MATYTSTACQTSSGGFFLNPPRYIENGVVARSAAFTFTTSASSGDVVQMVPVPKGALILDTQLDVGGLAAGSNVAVNVGDGNSTGRYNTSASVAAGVNGGAIFRMTNAAGGGYSYSADDTIDVIMGTVGSMSGQAVLRLTVFYSFDNASDGNS